jgi:hypothetical protein
MKLLNLAAFLGAAVALSGCNANLAPTDHIQFQALASQKANVRDGDMIISDRAAGSVVTMRAATREVGSEPVFIVGIDNLSSRPVDFKLSDVTAFEVVDGQDAKPLRVFAYEEMVNKEKAAHVGRMIGATVVASVTESVAGEGAGQAVLDKARAESDQNMAAINELYLKNQTIPAKGRFAGKLSLAAPDAHGEGARTKAYTIVIKIGDDVHRIRVNQVRA